MAQVVDGPVSPLVLDGGNLVVAHRALRADMHGRRVGRRAAALEQATQTRRARRRTLPCRCS